jgi:hypothetical protein
MIACNNGHFYDSREHEQCPFCQLRGSSTAKPQRGNQVATTNGVPALTTQVAWKQALDGIDPVVGWVVCIKGPDRGQDYRLHGERNFIGRSPSMDIALIHDRAVSRENHAFISYNPKMHQFRLAAGDQRGIVYLNQQEVFTPTIITSYDRIEIGASTLLFIAFCGEQFHWS